MSPRRATSGDRTEAPLPDRIVDPRAVRIALGPTAAHAGAAPIVIAPPAGPIAGGMIVIDGDPTHARLDRFGPVHGVLLDGRDETTRTPVLLMPVEGPGGSSSGVVRREVVVDGWRIEVEIESERRASLRERAQRGREETGRRGPTEVRAIIPGQVVSVSVAPGDAVVAGQQLLVVEAMKMQNELRAPREGVVSRVAVGAGLTIEVGDLLLVLE